MKSQITLSTAIVAALLTSQGVLADGKGVLTSKSVLSPEQEVQDPPVESNALGNAIITIDRKFRRAGIKVTYTGLEGEFTRMHFHCAPEGENGPVAVGLVDLVATALDNSETVTLDAKTLTGSLDNSQFPGDGGDCGIGNLRDLADAIDAGGVYWNMHTLAFPGGELRGQVEPLEEVGMKGKYDKKEKDKDDD